MIMDERVATDVADNNKNSKIIKIIKKYKLCW